MKLSFALVLVPLTFSCGGDDKPHIIVDGSVQMDAPAPEACKGQMSYTPTFGSDNQSVDDYPAAGSGADATIHQMYFTGGLDMNDPGDYLFIDLYQGYGAFMGSGSGSGSAAPDEIRTGQFTISGDEANYSTCGVCVTVAAQASSSSIDDWYMATGGIVNLTSVSGRLTGTLQNINFRRVVTDANGGPGDDPQPGPTGDCTSHIASASFDAPIMLGSAAASGTSARIAIPMAALGLGRFHQTKLAHRHY